MNSLDAAFHGMWIVAFLWSFGSFVTVKMSNKGEEPGMVPGGTIREFLESGSATFLCYEKLGESLLLWRLSMCCSCWSRLSSVLLGFFCLLKSSFVTFREEILKTLLLISSCCDCKESIVFFVLLGFSLLFESQFVLFQRRGLADFCTYCWNWFVESRTVCTTLKPLIGLVPIGEGPGDVAQWRGWTALSTSVCDSGSMFLHCICLSVLWFSFLFWALNFC